MGKVTFTSIILALLIILSCNPASENRTNDELVTSYIQGLNNSDFELISGLISDSLQTSEGGFILTKSKSEYKTHFKWDSVFNPEYLILDEKEISDTTLMLTLSKLCNRIRYLHDSATVYSVIFSFYNKQITSIDNNELIVFDTTKWSSRRDTLVGWIDKNHPELNGFIYDQTPIGAQNYLKAIELFSDRK